MKKILNNIVLFLLVISVIFGLILFRSYKNTKIKLKAEKQAKKELIEKCDSISNLPPDTTIVEKWLPSKEKIVYVKEYDEPTDRTKTYVGEVKNDSTDIKYEIEADRLIKVRFDVTPIYKYREVTVEKYVPRIVETVKKIEVQKRALYMGAGLGISDQFSVSAGLTYVTRNGYSYSYNCVRYGNTNIHLVSVGIRLFK